MFLKQKMERMVIFTSISDLFGQVLYSFRMFWPVYALILEVFCIVFAWVDYARALKYVNPKIIRGENNLVFQT